MIPTTPILGVTFMLLQLSRGEFSERWKKYIDFSPTAFFLSLLLVFLCICIHFLQLPQKSAVNGITWNHSSLFSVLEAQSLNSGLYEAMLPQKHGGGTSSLPSLASSICEPFLALLSYRYHGCDLCPHQYGVPTVCLCLHMAVFSEGWPSYWTHLRTSSHLILSWKFYFQ